MIDSAKLLKTRRNISPAQTDKHNKSGNQIGNKSEMEWRKFQEANKAHEKSQKSKKRLRLSIVAGILLCNKASIFTQRTHDREAYVSRPGAVFFIA
jgi:hypothetical protein